VIEKDRIHSAVVAETTLRGYRDPTGKKVEKSADTDESGSLGR